MERYEFKVKGPKEKCVKIFLSAEEVKTLGFKVYHVPHLNAISQPTLEGIELEICRHPEWLDWAPHRWPRFICRHDRDGKRLCKGKPAKTIELKVCELARTPKQTAQEHLRSSSSPNYETTSGSVHVAENQPARRLDEEFTCSLNESTDDREYESPTQKIFEKLEQQKHDVEQLSIKATRGIWAREPFQAGAWFFKETVVFKLSYFRAQQNYMLRCTLLFCYNM